MSVTPLVITVLTDTHYYSEENGTNGSAYENANSRSQKLLAGSADVLETAFEQIASDSESDVVIISGDVTNNGELNAHKEFIEMLRSLKSKGKKVFVITELTISETTAIRMRIKVMKKFRHRLLTVICYLICTVNSVPMMLLQFTDRVCHMLCSFATVTDFLH